MSQTSDALHFAVRAPDSSNNAEALLGSLSKAYCGGMERSFGIQSAFTVLRFELSKIEELEGSYGQIACTLRAKDVCAGVADRGFSFRSLLGPRFLQRGWNTDRSKQNSTSVMLGKMSPASGFIKLVFDPAQTAPYARILVSTEILFTPAVNSSGVRLCLIDVFQASDAACLASFDLQPEGLVRA